MDLKIGTMIKGGPKTSIYIERFAPIGIETIQLHFWKSIPRECDETWMAKIKDQCIDRDIKISAISLFTNPFNDEDDETQASKDWPKLLDLAASAEIPLISGFTGRRPGRPVEDSIEPVKTFFSPLLESCISHNISLAFENCPMDGDWQSGDWNIAFAPEGWEILFHQLFDTLHCGLEFDPSHCPAQNQNPIELVSDWKSRILHVHGKDTLSAPDYDFSFPGDGITNWPRLISILVKDSPTEAIDLEGYHSTFTTHDDEVERQRIAVDYLKRIR